jgi:peptide deformylase
MIKDILQIGSPILEKSTFAVDDFDAPFVKKVIADLLDTCKHHAHRAAGLAAPQIGYNTQICVCRRVDLEDRKSRGAKPKSIPDDMLWEVLINPAIKKTSNEMSTIWEGCLSIGKTEQDMIMGPVSRPRDVVVDYTDKDGNKKTLEATDFFSHVVQHEIDHLKGILFISRVPNSAENLWKSPDIEAYQSKHKSYPPIQT